MADVIRSEDGTVTIRGALPAGPFAFEPARKFADPSRWPETTAYDFDRVTAQHAEFGLDEIDLFVSGSEFDQCVFRQDAKLIKANRKEYHFSYGRGVLGWKRRSVYRRCTFDHVDFGSKGGGYSPGHARFEGCTFNHCAFRDFFAGTADFVDCTFVGTITKAVFFGRSFNLLDRAEPEPEHNDFAGNDFSLAKLRRTEFRQLDLRSTRLPEGPEYLRIDKFLAKAQRARAAIASWPDDERDHADFLLRLYEERWSEPLFLWRGSIAGRDSPLWQLLESLGAEGTEPLPRKGEPPL